jgi:tetratricopeptide (TPR) repeat protein
MTEQERYKAKTRQLKVFVRSDEVYGPDVSPRFRARKAGRALNVAEAALSRLDPLLTDIRFRYARALDQADKGARRLRDHLGYVIREASVIYGPDFLAVDELRGIQYKERRIGGARTLRRIERARSRADLLRGAGGLPYVFAVQDLADRYRAAGRHLQFRDTIDDLTGERERLGLDSEQRLVFAKSTGPALLEAGEVELALPLLAEAHEHAQEASDVSAAWEIGMLNIALAESQLAVRQYQAAETVLRGSLALFARFQGERHYGLLAKLRHRSAFELGTALFCQDRLDEAVERFQEATDLLAALPNPHEATFTAYRNTRTYAALVAREEAAS